jgi:hypothetical protein
MNEAVDEEARKPGAKKSEPQRTQRTQRRKMSR